METIFHRPYHQRILPPVLFMACVATMVALHLLWPGTTLRWRPAYNILPAILLVGGLGMAIWGSMRFSRLHTNIQTFGEPGQLVTNGLFRYSRNPMYLGMVLALLGVAKLLGTASPLLVVVAFLIVTDRWYIAFEEQQMKAKFGDAYLAYQRRTRRWL